MAAIASIQQHRQSRRHARHPVQSRQRLAQQPAIRAIGSGGHQMQRDPSRIGQPRAFTALFAAIHGGATRHLSTARRLGDAPIHADMAQVHADQPVVVRQTRAWRCGRSPASAHAWTRRRMVRAEHPGLAIRS